MLMHILYIIIMYITGEYIGPCHYIYIITELLGEAGNLDAGLTVNLTVYVCIIYIHT